MTYIIRVADDKLRAFRRREFDTAKEARIYLRGLLNSKRFPKTLNRAHDYSSVTTKEGILVMADFDMKQCMAGQKHPMKIDTVSINTPEPRPVKPQAIRKAIAAGGEIVVLKRMCGDDLNPTKVRAVLRQAIKDGRITHIANKRWEWAKDGDQYNKVMEILDELREANRDTSA